MVVRAHLWPVQEGSAGLQAAAMEEPVGDLRGIGLPGSLLQAMAQAE